MKVASVTVTGHEPRIDVSFHTPNLISYKSDRSVSSITDCQKTTPMQDKRNQSVSSMV